MAYGVLKQNLSLGDFVTIGQTGGDENLEGMEGRILGKGMESPEADFYIVLLSKPLPDRAAIVITEACLSKIQTPPWWSDVRLPSASDQ